jgi:hypothetical protein
MFNHQFTAYFKVALTSIIIPFFIVILSTYVFKLIFLQQYLLVLFSLNTPASFPLLLEQNILFAKTRSGNIMRRVLKKLWTGEPLGDLSTKEEDVSVKEIKEAALN